MKFPPWIPTAVQASIGLAGAVALCLLLTKAASMCGAAKGICMDLKMGAVTARNIISTVCCTAYNEGVRSGRSRREALPNYLERREAVRRAEVELQNMRGSRMLSEGGQEEGDEAPDDVESDHEIPWVVRDGFAAPEEAPAAVQEEEVPQRAPRKRSRPSSASSAGTAREATASRSTGSSPS